MPFKKANYMSFPSFKCSSLLPLEKFIGQKFSLIKGMFLLLIAIITPNYTFANQEIASLRQVFDGAVTPDKQVYTFSHSDKWFPVHVIKKGTYLHELSKSKIKLANITFDVNGKRYDLFDYLSLNRVAALLVLKNGKIVFEDYELGTKATTHWPSFSMAKSVVSTLVGIALKDGYIESLNDPISKYVSELKGSPYDNVSVRNAMQMTSGIKWDETYTDPYSERSKLLEMQLNRDQEAVLPFMSTLEKAAEPGTVWNYNSGDVFLVGTIIERVTNKPLAEYLSQKIWKPWGMESNASWWLLSHNGMGVGNGGIAATLRDFGRFGLLVQEDGVVNGNQIVPKGWFNEAGSSKLIGGKQIDYGYLWWTFPKEDTVHDGAFQAKGICGQHIYINKKEKVVIVVLSSRPKPVAITPVNDGAFFAAVVKALHGSS
ncbi:TPA: serine hydrolase domain-containing protein [Legionella pneumophila]|uniref:serine hydrolase domain-containing protein n=1 Tax=Legionella pneumophila TaxID=446 RepID=UPI0009B19FA0|nr:serine hydrolase [Legionella pneumophila]HAT8853605.1 serine hydrolase [Legionella pneumophila subsp. pneumophila]HAU0346217.1 serine hydrolase [Legionella pneumophila]HAU0358189.1 serine hydrolase [Legionella pneumophila]HAU0543986.1 serine hydrolase [Legionella pneumophila]HBD7060395.1 serine hydrolase [Legionella pneumophila]